MKMKINKACDLSSISVLPPHTRRSSTVPPGPQVSQQLRSQQHSQQSFSQSQHGMFSQLSQNSLDEIVTNDQRFGSQERENSMKRISCLAPVSFTREESQIPISRSSTSLTRKWSSSTPDHRCQIGEHLEHRIGMMETSLTRFGMVLDSIQNDIMQVNRGTKEFLMDMEGLRQKLTVHDNSLQLMTSGQEDIKTSLDRALKFISDQMGKDFNEDKLQQTLLTVSALPDQIDVCLLKFQNELHKTITKEMQEITCSLKTETPNQKYAMQTVFPPNSTSCCAALQEKPQPLKRPVSHPKICMQTTLLSEVEMGSWKSVKRVQASFPNRNKQHKQKGVSPDEQERECRVIMDSDEEIDGGFSCLLQEKEAGNYLVEEAKEETERILRKARRRKRKYSRTIILN